MEPLDRQAELELLELLGQFNEERLRPWSGEVESGTQRSDGLRTELHGIGLFPAVAEEYGGQGEIDPAAQLRLLQKLAAGDAAFALEVGATAQAARIVADAGTEDQRSTLLRRLADEPRLTATVGYYEGYGRGPADLGTTAIRNGTGWLLEGVKRTVFRPDAELRIVVAGLGNGGLAAFVLDDAGPVEVVLDEGTRSLMGLRSARTGTLRLERTELPAGALIGELDGLPLHRAVAWCRLVPAMVALAIAESARDYAVGYALEREAFGRKIIDYQGVEFPLAESDMAIHAATLTVQAAWEGIASSVDRAAIARLTTDAVHFVTAAAQETSKIAVNTLGGHGYLVDHPVERWYREATVLSALDYDPLVATAGPDGVLAGVPRAW